MAHAGDRIEFTPGGRVTVGFRPRSGDGWEVGGRAPRALPAGSASGRDMLPAAAVVPGAPASGARRRRPEPTPSAAPSEPAAPTTAPRRPRRRPDRGPIPAAGGRRRLGHAAARRRRHRRRRHAPPPPGHGLPPVLGGERRRPRLRAALDDRLLQRRLGQERQPPEARPRRDGDDRLGRLDQLADDLDHQRRPHEGHARRADDQRVRLDERPGDAPGPAPRQPDGPAEPRQAGGGSRPRPRRRRHQPRLRADRLRLRRRVHGLRPDGPGRARQAGAGLPADVRHDRLHRQLPARGRDRARRRRRDLHHGLRLPRRPARATPARSTRCRARPTTSRTRSTPTPRASRRRS